MAKIKVQSKAFARLYDMGPEVMEEIDTKLLHGQSPAYVAKWLQQDLGQCTDIQPDSVKKMLERYRVTHLRKKVLDEATKASANLSVSFVKKRVNALEELEQLYAMQRDRAHRLYMREYVRDQPSPGLREEMKLMKDTLVSIGNLQLETGVIAKAGKVGHGTFIDADGTAKTFEWTEAQERLFRELEEVTYVGGVAALPSA